jgi:hypothetical protein
MSHAAAWQFLVRAWPSINSSFSSGPNTPASSARLNSSRVQGRSATCSCVTYASGPLARLCQVFVKSAVALRPQKR